MNREIKFRVWDIATRTYPFVGFSVIGEVMLFDFIEQYIAETWEMRSHRRDGSKLLALNDFILEQYTGLKDADGREIYEGDILKDSYYHIQSLVEWVNNGFWCELEDGRCYMPNQENREVVGNIREPIK